MSGRPPPPEKDSPAATASVDRTAVAALVRATLRGVEGAGPGGSRPAETTRRQPLAARFALPPLKPEVLSVRTIADLQPELASALGVPEGKRAVGLITCTSDDALYVALDEGTKAAQVEVVYAKSFYAGAAHASGPLSGEVIGCYASHDIDEIHAALAACRRCLADEAWFYAAELPARAGGGGSGSIAFFPHVVRATGHYLSKQAGIAAGQPMCYLIAPPVEALVALDAAIKTGGVRLLRFFGPPTETNFAGAYLGGELAACEAAAEAFTAAILDVSHHPQPRGSWSARGAGERLSRASARGSGRLSSRRPPA